MALLCFLQVVGAVQQPICSLANKVIELRAQHWMPAPIAFEVYWTWEGFVLEANSIVSFGRSTGNKRVNDAGIKPFRAVNA